MMCVCVYVRVCTAWTGANCSMPIATCPGVGSPTPFRCVCVMCVCVFSCDVYDEWGMMYDV